MCYHRRPVISYLRSLTWTRLAEQRFGVAVVTVAVGCMFLMYGLGLRTQRVEGDGVYNWMFARSLAFDGDIHFANDYQVCGDPWRVGRLRGTQHPDNTFYVGPSVVWVPLLLVARVVAPIPETAAPTIRQGCWGRYAAVVLAFTPLLGGLALFLSYRAARRFAGDGAAAARDSAARPGQLRSRPTRPCSRAMRHAYSAVAAALMTSADPARARAPRVLGALAAWLGARCRWSR